MREATIRDLLGHLRIYKRGFLTDGLIHPYDYMINDPEKLLATLERWPHVVTAGPRLSYFGLIGNGDTTLPFVMQAFDPAHENRMRNTTMLLSGHFIEPGENFDVLLGRGLANAIGLREGGSAVLIGNTQRGGMNAMDVNIAGVFRTVSKDSDDTGMRCSIQLAQKMLRIDGAQMVIVFLDNTRNTDDVRASLQKKFAAEGLDYDIQPWYDVPDAAQITIMKNVYLSIYRVIKIVLFLFVILSIVNTMNMSVLERIGEIGTLMALGTRRNDVLRLFMIEGVILGLAGGLGGVLLGCLLAIVLSAIGIPMPAPPGSNVEWIARIAITPACLASAFTMALATSFVSSILPALKASRLEIAEALRHNI